MTTTKCLDSSIQIAEGVRCEPYRLLKAINIHYDIVREHGCLGKSYEEAIIALQHAIDTLKKFY